MPIFISIPFAKAKISAALFLSIPADVIKISGR
jgi:hypothetical protein